VPIEHVPGGPDRPPLAHEAGRDEPDALPTHPLDTAEAMAELRKVEDFYDEANEAWAETFAEMALDHDYYDHHQWSDMERAELIARGQAPLVFNKCAMVIDWLTGTERRTRIDYSVKAKAAADVDEARVKDHLLKYQSDTNMIGWHRSRAFKDASIAGLGWVEAALRGDNSQSMILHRYQAWNHMRLDPFSRDLDLDDARHLSRRRWLDLDYAIAAFPEREAILRLAARSHLFGDEEWGQEQLDLPQVFRKYDSRGAEVVQRRWTSSTPISGSTLRLRVPVTETFFREPQRIQKVFGLNLDGVPFDPNDQGMAEAVKAGYASLADCVKETMRLHMWVPGGSVWRGESKYKHGGFPFTPIWCKRRDRDGMPYGVVRGIRDAQDDFNKRLSKAQWLLATNQLHYEASAVDDDQRQQVRRELSKPSGMVKFNDNALAMGRVKVERNVELADAQVGLLEIAATHIHDGSGVNRELLGRETNAISGRAIRAKQDEGSVTTAELFDNLRLAVQLDGKKLLSLSEQFLTLPMQVRIAGDDGREVDWLEINQPELVDDHWEVKNDITRTEADFVVDQVDWRESVRAAQAEQFMEMVGTVPPEIQAVLLDIAIDMMDVPNKKEAIRRIRAFTGQGPTDDQDPAAAAQRQQREEADAAERDLQMRERLAKAGLDEARTKEVMARARSLSVEGKGKALDVAALLEALLPLVPAADRLCRTPEGASNAEPQPAQPQPA